MTPMQTASLNEQDIAVLLNFISEIHESTEIDLIECQELRFTLANIVGDLKSQFGDTSSTIPNKFRKRVHLDDLLADKFREWESERLIDDSVTRSAISILEFHLSNSGRSTDSFIGSGDAVSAVMSFKWALDHCKAWDQFEVQLCATSLKEIENLSFEDMVHSLVLYAYN